MSFVFTGKAEFKIKDAEELELVAGPSQFFRIVSRLRVINNDASSITPAIAIKNTSDEALAEDMEYVKILPANAIASGGFLEDESPVAIIGQGQSLIIQLAAEPSDVTDESLLPTVLVSWYDSR